MTALSLERMTEFAGTVPARGTYGIKANKRIFKGALVGIDSAGRAMPGDTIANGCLSALGKASATYDNRTGSALGGSADAAYVEVEYGVFDFVTATGADEITADDVGKVCYVVDDQTVALTNNSDTRGIAGFVTEVRDSKVYVWMGPHVTGMIVIAAAEASQLDTAQTDIDTAQADIDALEVDAATANATMHIPLTSFLDADGDPLAKFVDASSPTFGFALVNSEALCLRWNNDATPGTALCQISLPKDLDDTAAAQLEFLCSKTGATVGDATTLTLTGFITAAGDLHDADSDMGGATNALTGDATAKTTALLSRTLAAADIPAGAVSMTFTVTPTAGTLGTDDLCLHAVRLRYKRKIQTA
jgi:hypothetical protein